MLWCIWEVDITYLTDTSVTHYIDNCEYFCGFMLSILQDMIL